MSGPVPKPPTPEASPSPPPPFHTAAFGSRGAAGRLAKLEGDQNRQMVLRDFLRLIAGNRIHLRENTQDNGELVALLKDLHVVRSERVERALLLCPRGTFVPAEYADEAYSDAPIRVKEMEFNISAPHMHATCLEALEVQKGDRFLDVGSGCGIVTAAAAYLVGKSGECIGIDIKAEILDFAKGRVDKLLGDNPSYSAEACEIQFEQQNVFMPSKFRGYFDKIHVGGTCREDRLDCIVQLLRPEGGKLIVPVDNDLKLITRRPDGRLHHKVLTQVRFSELQVPTDADIVLSTMESENKLQMQVQVPPSTLPEDAHLARSFSMDSQGGSPDRKAKRSRPAMFSVHEGDQGEKVARGRGSPTHSALKVFCGCASGNGRRQREEDVDLEALTPDCVLVGEGWRIPAHRGVLKARCEHFRAQFDSGMKDANNGELRSPETFEKEPMSMFLHYVYKDELPGRMDANVITQVLHIACYYGVPRLIAVCEKLLAKELLSMDTETAAEYAPQLLQLVCANGLQNLQTVVLNYVSTLPAVLTALKQSAGLTLST
eukprot:evm.model.scf_1524.2 EVM.evm.TU.scf_1524.2   scf_1524:3912-16148(-)